MVRDGGWSHWECTECPWFVFFIMLHRLSCQFHFIFKKKIKKIQSGKKIRSLVCLCLHNWTSLKVLSWPPDVKSWLIWEDPDAGKDWGQEEKGMTEDKMIGCHHRLDGHGFGWIPGVGDRQGGLVCCNSWGRKESDTTEWLNWTELKVQMVKNPPAMWETWVRSLDWEDPLE